MESGSYASCRSSEHIWFRGSTPRQGCPTASRASSADAYINRSRLDDSLGLRMDAGPRSDTLGPTPTREKGVITWSNPVP